MICTTYIAICEQCTYLQSNEVNFVLPLTHASSAVKVVNQDKDIVELFFHNQKMEDKYEWYKGDYRLLPLMLLRCSNVLTKLLRSVSLQSFGNAPSPEYCSISNFNNFLFAFNVNVVSMCSSSSSVSFPWPGKWACSYFLINKTAIKGMLHTPQWQNIN